MSFGVFQFRRGTAGEWTSANPVLASGEIGLETGATPKIKIGDGATAWNALGYAGIAGPTGATGNAPVQIEVNVGLAPVYAYTNTYTVSGMTTAHKVVASVSGDMPGTRDDDELEVEPVLVWAKASATDTVQLNLVPSRADGALYGAYNINILYG